MVFQRPTPFPGTVAENLAALVHADPQAQEGTDHHAALALHR
jgi:ABC-type phosphate transport system ATPase subunit